MYSKVKTIIALILFPYLGFAQNNIDQDKLNALVEQAKATNSEALIVYQGDKLITESYFGIGKPETKIESMSSTKSIVGLAVASLISDGIIENLDVPVYHFYPEWKQGSKQEITIGHLVHMTSGIQNVPNAGKEIYPSSDFVQLALTAELSSKPGEVFSYNNKSLNLMSGVIQKATGKRMDKYIADRIFKPLDIVDYRWTLDKVGNPHVMSGCQLRPADFVKIGRLLLKAGKYNGQEVISPQAIEMVIKPSSKNKAYGMLWWLDYENTTSIVDDGIISEMKQAGIDQTFLDKMQQIKGRYSSQNEFLEKVTFVFGSNPWIEINETVMSKQVQFRKREYSGNITYKAEGYLGNFIIVDPKTEIVAIRMTSHESHESPKDNFGHFKQIVLGLTK